MAGNDVSTGACRRVSRLGLLGVALVGVGAWPLGAHAAVPLLAQAGQALVAPGLDQAAKPVGAAQPADGAAAEGSAAPVQADLAAAAKKYGPSYVLMVLVVGLGVFIICRPSPRVVEEKQ